MTGLLYILLFMIALRRHLGTCQVTIEFDIISYMVQVNEGSDIGLLCRISGPFNDASDSVQFGITRNNFLTPGRVIYERSIQRVVYDPNEIRFDGVQTSGDIATYFITLLSISRYECGFYYCAANQTGSGSGFFLSNSLQLVVSYPPPGVPFCKTIPPRTFTWNDGDVVQLQCVADPGGPRANLTWRSSNEKIILPDAVEFESSDVSTNTIIVSLLTVQVDLTFHDVTMFCSRQHAQYPSTDASCFIGPLNVTGFDMVTMGTRGPTGSSSGIIAGIVISLIIIITMVTIVIFLFKSGRLRDLHEFIIDKTSTEQRTGDSGMTSVMPASGQQVESRGFSRTTSSQKPSDDGQYTDLNFAECDNTAYMNLEQNVSGYRNEVIGSASQHRTSDDIEGDNAAGQYTELKRSEHKDSFYMALVHKQNNIQVDSPPANQPNPDARDVSSDVDDQYTEFNLSESKENSYMDLKPSSTEVEDEHDKGDYVNRLDDPNYENV